MVSGLGPRDFGLWFWGHRVYGFEVSEVQTQHGLGGWQDSVVKLRTSKLQPGRTVGSSIPDLNPSLSSVSEARKAKRFAGLGGTRLGLRPRHLHQSRIPT